MKTKKISVDWIPARAEAVPVVRVVGLEILAVDRLIQFVRNNPNSARYSARNDVRRGTPVPVL